MAIHDDCEYVRTDKRGTRWYRCPRCGDEFSETHPTQWGEPCEPASTPEPPEGE